MSILDLIIDSKRRTKLTDAELQTIPPILRQCFSPTNVDLNKELKYLTTNGIKYTLIQRVKFIFNI